MNAKRFQLYSLAWGADYPDPQNFLDLLFHSASQGNKSNYRNPQVDALLEQARSMRDQKARFALYQEIERMILEDAPWVLLWNDADWWFLVKPYVRDYYLLPMTIPKLRYVWLER